MPQAKWNGQVIADTDVFETVEGNIYFPPNSINREFFKESDKTTFCPWKGTANYFDVIVDGNVNEAAAWYYSDPKPEAANISGHIAFWKGVEVISG